MRKWRWFGGGTAGGSVGKEMASWMEEAKLGGGDAATWREARVIERRKHATEFKRGLRACGAFGCLLSMGQVERRRGPSELASAFLFPSFHCGLHPVSREARLVRHYGLRLRRQHFLG